MYCEIPERNCSDDSMVIERAFGNHESAAMRSLEWARKEARIADLMEKDGFYTLYCCQEQNGQSIRSIKLIEHKGRFSLLVGGKNVHVDNDINACVRWGKAAGYISRNETIKPHATVSAQTSKAATTMKASVPASKAAAPKDSTQRTAASCSPVITSIRFARGWR